MHYLPVDIEYEEALMEFVKIKAKDIELKLALNKKKDGPNWKNLKQTEKMFYYWLNKHNYLEFIFFDYMMRSVLFGEKYVKEKRNRVSQDVY